MHKDGRNVDIIVTNMASAVAPIFQFHSMVIMNFISAEAVFCAYLARTLEMSGLVHPRIYKQNGTNLATIISLTKYIRRGFTLYSDITELSQHDSRCVKTYYCPHMTRSTNDKGRLAWVFRHAETPGTSSHSASYIDTSAIIWCLGGDQCANENVSRSPSFIFAT
ncbi:uncharacterized protein EDB91DRAFT_1044670 [Suillus paluster]|uniref:uncharacterized protein n=1 Tax=Suillus paluster TaxID=48578 RepID=UPI001B871A4E|nr:uncharacterized protein EDB91DRAFT_1044670 [Suillus paluster]KAG1752317.1 hypothetical protein EDB91DRAFT_1044670 [Suillus paluster]